MSNTEISRIQSIIEILSQIKQDCGDNRDRAGEYTSDKIGQAIEQLEKVIS